jgi:hypothetical protein
MAQSLRVSAHPKRPALRDREIAPEARRTLLGMPSSEENFLQKICCKDKSIITEYLVNNN